LFNSTVLDDRTLCYDGDSIVEPDTLIELVLDGKPIGDVYVSKITPDIEKYNNMLTKRIEVKTFEKELDFDWNIPEEYLSIDLDNYVIDKFNEQSYNTTNGEWEKRLARVMYELTYFNLPEHLNFIRTLIYVNDEMEKNNIVKGVGRGSSVASYVLYLIGTHHIDSYKYGLEFHEFIKIED